MNTQTEVDVMTVTPEMAQAWLTGNRYEHQRNVRTSHVRYLAEEIERGAFKQDTVIEFTSTDGEEWLTDGQHRLAAVVYAKTPQRFVIVKRKAKDESELAMDYTKTDQVLVRSTADAYRTLNIENELGLAFRQVNKLGAAVKFIYNRFNPSGDMKIHRDDLLRMMREYNDAYGEFLEVTAGSPYEMKPRKERRATIAVAIVTFRYSAAVYGSQKIEDFWTGVFLDDGLKLLDPRKVANRHLLEVGMTGGTATRASSSIGTPYFSARYLATCFNAFVSGEQMKFARPDASKPITILGSPFNGK